MQSGKSYTELAPFRIVALTGAIVLAGELGLMFAIDELGATGLPFQLSRMAWGVLEAIFLTSLVALALYFFVIRKLHGSNAEFREIATSAHDAIVTGSVNGRIVGWNAAASRIFGYQEQEVSGNLLAILMPERFRKLHSEGLARVAEGGKPKLIGHVVEVFGLRKDGSEFPMEISLAQWCALDGGHYFTAIIRDISERKQFEAKLLEANKQLREAHSMLLQSEKMASIGQLAAGVAHEINNPIGYVHSNLGTLEKYVQDAFDMIELYEQSECTIADPETRGRLQAARHKLDLAFLKQDLHDLMNESKEGITRVKTIVQNLKDFSHVDASEEWHYADLRKGLDSTLVIAHNEIKYKADVVKDYGDIPEVECLPSQLNQVFMNLLVNAAHAIEERGTIIVRTGAEGYGVWVEVVDTGKGIAPEHLKRIFDPFFTTKPVGKGTGLGLSLSYGIVQKHHGRIEVQSEPGKGAIFRVWLPVQQPSAEIA